MKAQIVIVLLVLLLAACTPPQPIPVDRQNTALAIAGTGIALTQTALPTFTPTADVVYPTPSALPTQPPFPVLTPDVIQVERWREYETALAQKLFPSSFIPGEFLCEWELLGRSEQEVYVWAVCMSIFSVGDIGPYGGSNPAVINVDASGVIQSIEVPGGGTSYASDIHQMFPLIVQERYFNSLIPFQELTDHLRWRREHPEEPPLIILGVTLTATPIP